MSKTTSKQPSKTTKKKAAAKKVINAEADVKAVDNNQIKEAEEINLDLEESIDKLLEEKQVFVRPDAIEAKKQLDEFQGSFSDKEATYSSSK